jgi:hypothetical protein
MSWFSKKEKQIIEYKILISPSFYSLQDDVNKGIRNGWQPIGGVCGSLNHNYIQAVVKYK